MRAAPQHQPLSCCVPWGTYSRVVCAPCVLGSPPPTPCHPQLPGSTTHGSRGAGEGRRLSLLLLPSSLPPWSGASRAANLLGSAVCSSSRQAELKRSPGDPAGFSAVDASSKVKAAARCCRPLCPPLKEEFPSRDGSLRIAQGLPSCCGCCRLSACSEAAEENPRPPLAGSRGWQ